MAKWAVPASRIRECLWLFPRLANEAAPLDRAEGLGTVDAVQNRVVSSLPRLWPGLSTFQRSGVCL